MNPKGILISCAILTLCSGCATNTITPDVVEAHGASYDEGKRNSGFIAYTRGADGKVDGAIHTQGGLDHFRSLIAFYGVQYKSEHHLDLTGWQPKPYQSIDGKPAWWFDAQHESAFDTLGDWQHSRRDPDSIWQKAGQLLTPL